MPTRLQRGTRQKLPQKVPRVGSRERMGLGAEFVPQLQDRVGKRVVQWGCVGAQPNPAEPSGSSRRANLPPRLPWHRLEPCSLSISEGSTETSRLPKTGHLGIEAVQAGRAAVAAQSSKGTCSAEYIITLLSSSCLQERHLRMLWKEPPAVKKAQMPIQKVMM